MASGTMLVWNVVKDGRLLATFIDDYRNVAERFAEAVNGETVPARIKEREVYHGQKKVRL